MPTATAKQTSEEIVRGKYPRATATSLIGGWEITETEDTFSSNILGSGAEYPATDEQLVAGYDSTEEAAWDDAARTILATEKLAALAGELVSELSYIVQGSELSEDQKRWAIGRAARLVYDAQVPKELRDLAPLICTQDNAITADPIFIVYEKIRHYGFDTQWSDDTIVWLRSSNDNEEATEEEAKALEDDYFVTAGTIPEDWTRTAYQDIDRFKMAFFTRKAAEEYIRRNGHNLKRPHIFVESMYRNYEMIAVRDFLESL